MSVTAQVLCDLSSATMSHHPAGYDRCAVQRVRRG
jgi:hypothetical protein